MSMCALTKEIADRLSVLPKFKMVKESGVRSP